MDTPSSPHLPTTPPTHSHAAALDRRLLIGAAGLAGIAALAAGRAKAGPLNPPAGAVASTGKTLTEVEPRTAITATNTPGTATGLFRITQPGSYYLTGNIVGVAGKSGIEITADDVTVDLMGFKVLGVAGSLNGITTSGASISDRTCIRNGSVNGWGSNGVHLSGGGGTGVGSVVEDVEAIGNGARGIYTNDHSLVRRCSARDNVTEGFILTGEGVVESCNASGNGLTGIIVSGTGRICGCVAENNGGSGITTGQCSTVENCSAISNTLVGINTATTSVIRGCAVMGNGTTGIVASSICIVESCAANNNGGAGISTGTRSQVRGCSAAANTTQGIGFGSDSLIAGNTVNGNQAAGLSSAGTDSRIEGNHASDNATGIDLTNVGNIVMGNTCAGNATNYDLVASNNYGTIVSRVGVVTAAVNGSAAPGTLATTDPHANFSF